MHIAAGEAAVVIGGGNELRAFVALADDIGLAGLPLCIEAVELLFEALLVGFSGVDGTADGLGSFGRRIGLLLEAEESGTGSGHAGDLLRVRVSDR